MSYKELKDLKVGDPLYYFNGDELVTDEIEYLVPQYSLIGMKLCDLKNVRHGGFQRGHKSYYIVITDEYNKFYLYTTMEELSEVLKNKKDNIEKCLEEINDTEIDRLIDEIENEELKTVTSTSDVVNDGCIRIPVNKPVWVSTTDWTSSIEKYMNEEKK